MTKKKEKGFTLIELIGVLVIMAVIALIVTPLVMNIIRKARVSADKRSIDEYGRSIELAIAGYLLDNGTFPTSIAQLTIEYSGDEVVCSTTQLNSDSSVYLAGCTVGGRSVEGYTYGTDKTSVAPTYTAYSIGDEVSYNNVDYYVIADSGTSESTVTLLKATPITSSEISSYLSSTELASKVDTSGTYAQMAYYSSATCKLDDDSGCTTDYEQSDIKYVVDIWKNSQASLATEARLITIDELRNNLGYDDNYSPNNSVPTWLYDNNNNYWMINSQQNSSAWYIDSRGYISSTATSYPYVVIRPVIVLPKSELN